MPRHVLAWWSRGSVLGSAAFLVVGCAGRSVQHEREGVSTGGAGADASSGVGGSGGSGATGANGGSGASGGSGAIGAQGGTGTRGGAAGSTIGATGGTGGSPAECLLAVRVDQCCGEPTPVTRAAYEADPCWAAWDPSGASIVARPGCVPVPCPAACRLAEPETRVVEVTADGSCALASECDSDDDCTLLWDAHGCCSCDVTALPRSFAGEGCWVAEGGNAPAGCNACGPTVCNCPDPGPPTCVRTPSGLGRCIAVRSHLTPGQCAAEQACPQGGANGGCPVCVAPGDMACGGPAPPPPACMTDAECSVAATNLICEAAPCRNLACVAGCIADGDCAPSEVCGADHRCAPAACRSDSECSPNRRCDAGRCVRRRCTVSSECGDYCVNNTCYERAGACADGCLP